MSMNEDQRSDWTFEGLLSEPNLGGGRLHRTQIVNALPESRTRVKPLEKDILSTVQTTVVFLSIISAEQSQLKNRGNFMKRKEVVRAGSLISSVLRLFLS